MKKNLIRIKVNLITILVGFLATLVLFVDAASASAFNGYSRPSRPLWAFNNNTRPAKSRPSAPPTYKRGPENQPGDRGPKFYRGQPFSPYGGGWRGSYGERKIIESGADAQRMLNDYYTKRNLRVGPVRENKFYFEADILDRNNRFIDRVIVDKRSGRIRSVY